MGQSPVFYSFFFGGRPLDKETKLMGNIYEYYWQKLSSPFLLGAILHLLYSGVSPSAVIPSGVDNTIPLQLSDQVSSEVQLFISQLLQPQPEYRLGAGSRGSHDVRSHPFFNGWNWSSMSWD